MAKIHSKNCSTELSEEQIEGNGEIDFEEFLMMMSKKMNGVDHEAELKEAFEIFDRDQTGFINPADLKFVMSQLGEKLTDEEVREMMREADTDDRGKLTWEKFYAIMMKEG
ncbi:CALM4-like protein [Mya arenaria]|uniref:CALM4-like protein n=1 Tax=Mya arenaria TaxID=6604 RepID=A0ABY7FC51_MYAAR|nr:CALM4-like protein [Mya arenaria]